MVDRLVVSSVVFSEDGVELAFMAMPGDVRNEGLLLSSRVLAVARSHPSYTDEIEELESAARALVADVLEDWDDAPVGFAGPEEDVDEDAGMGSG